MTLDLHESSAFVKGVNKVQEWLFNWYAIVLFSIKLLK